MTHSSEAVSVERIGNYVHVVVGMSAAKLTVFEAHVLVRALEQAIDETEQPVEKAKVSVH